jgi:hypothetical protein
MTRIASIAFVRPRRALASAVIAAGLLAGLAACGGADYGPQTSGAIQSDIDSSRWVNQLPQIPDSRRPTLE